jgi:hypothetical protein
MLKNTNAGKGKNNSRSVLSVPFDNTVDLLEASLIEDMCKDGFDLSLFDNCNPILDYSPIQDCNSILDYSPIQDCNPIVDLGKCICCINVNIFICVYLYTIF